MPEFVARNFRKAAKVVAAYATYLALAGGLYDYERVAKINENFPVFAYAGPGVVAFMDPDNMEIAMPIWEKLPYGSKEHFYGMKQSTFMQN